MSFVEFINQKREIHDSFLNFLDDDCYYENSFQNLINILNEQKIEENFDELIRFLYFIINISNNYHRSPLFYNKIDKILSHLSNAIKQISNKELIDIFGSNKRILLFLIKAKIITIDENFINFYKNLKSKITSYGIYFYYELQSALKKSSEQYFNALESEKDRILTNNPELFTNFEEKRQTGENDSYLCYIIRNDSIVEFITYVNQTNLSLSNTLIQPSIFETNSLLKTKAVTLIQYSAFFGSIQIFNYLRMNGVKMFESLWFFAIHGRNPEIIHYLEESNIKLIDKIIKKCLKISIKCHHNEISNYIFDNLVTETNEEFNKLIVEYSVLYYNWSLVPTDFDNNFIFCLLCGLNYLKFVKFISDKKEIDINKVVQIIFNQ